MEGKHMDMLQMRAHQVLHVHGLARALVHSCLETRVAILVSMLTWKRQQRGALVGSVIASRPPNMIEGDKTCFMTRAACLSTDVACILHSAVY